MNTDKTKLIALGLALTLTGGVVGAFTSRSFSPGSQPAAQAPQPAAQAPTPQPAPVAQAVPQVQMPAQLEPGQTYQLVPVGTTPDQTAQAQTAQVAPAPRVVTRTRTVYRNSARTAPPQRTYYTYDEAPPQRKQSFWSRHRDILTVAAGAGTGAAIGGLAGGKKGAGIGAIAGGVGSAVYTYGIRKRN